MRIFSVIFLACSLVGCASTPAEPVIRTVETKVPVPVACIPADFPGPPTYPDTRAALQAAQSAEDRAQLRAAGWFPRDARLTALEGVVANCMRIAPP